jgi:hypothetical protein
MMQRRGQRGGLFAALVACLRGKEVRWGELFGSHRPKGVNFRPERRNALGGHGTARTNICGIGIELSVLIRIVLGSDTGRFEQKKQPP